MTGSGYAGAGAAACRQHLRRYRTKVQRKSSGPHRGGCIYRRGTLYHLLSNRLYRGFIVHKGTAYSGEHEAIVDEQFWDKVQAMLATNASGSSRRLKQQHPSLLVSKVIDGEGREMTPSHASKSRKRYRYYVTRPDQLDGTRAWRVSAHDLEQLVCTSIAGKLTDGQFIIDLAGSRQLEAEQLQRAGAEADLAAATLRSGKSHAKAELLGTLVRQVRLHEERVEVELDNEAIGNRLGLSLEPGLGDPTVITIEAVRVRRGHQLRLIVPGRAPANQEPVRRDDKLVVLIAEAQKAKELVLANPTKSIARIAREGGRCRTRLGKLVALSCLAPDIVTAIVEGKQPEQLTAARLLETPLPLAWADQRREFGLS